MPLPRTTQEQRRPYFEDLIQLLTTGFLSHMVSVNGCAFSLRNLHEPDFFLCRHRIGTKYREHHKEIEWQRWLVASSVWMIDGWHILGERHAINTAYQSLQRLPNQTVASLFRIVMALMHKQNTLVEDLSTFLYEEDSRNLWYQARDMGIGTTRFCGVPGVESMGLNTVQRIWKAYNEVEDARWTDRQSWQHAKLIASANAPKAIQSLNNKEKAALDAEAERKLKELDDFYYRKKGVLKEGESRRETVTSPTSPDELAEDMRKWVAGEWDDHDKIVHAYKTRIREEKEKQAIERQQRLMAVRREMIQAEVEEELESLDPLVGYTKEELAKLLVERGKVPQRRVGRIVEGTSRDVLYEKYIESDADRGLLQTEGGKVTVRDKQDLQRAISNRKVKMDVKGETDV